MGAVICGIKRRDKLQNPKPSAKATARKKTIVSARLFRGAQSAGFAAWASCGCADDSDFAISSVDEAIRGSGYCGRHQYLCKTGQRGLFKAIRVPEVTPLQAVEQAVA